jgi:hypothetical protein
MFGVEEIESVLLPFFPVVWFELVVDSGVLQRHGEGEWEEMGGFTSRRVGP